MIIHPYIKFITMGNTIEELITELLATSDLRTELIHSCLNIDKLKVEVITIEERLHSGVVDPKLLEESIKSIYRALPDLYIFRELVFRLTKDTAKTESHHATLFINIASKLEGRISKLSENRLDGRESNYTVNA